MLSAFSGRSSGGLDEMFPTALECFVGSYWTGKRWVDHLLVELQGHMAKELFRQGQDVHLTSMLHSYDLARPDLMLPQCAACSMQGCGWGTASSTTTAHGG